MGIDYYNCANCNIPFPDVVGFTWCTCGVVYCDECQDEQKELYGLDEDGELQQCVSCDPKLVEKRERIEYERLRAKYEEVQVEER